MSSIEENEAQRIFRQLREPARRAGRIGQREIRGRLAHNEFMHGISHVFYNDKPQSARRMQLRGLFGWRLRTHKNRQLPSADAYVEQWALSGLLRCRGVLIQCYFLGEVVLRN